PPEWYVLTLHGLMGLAQRINPALSFMGSMAIPGLALLFVLALPWLDRRPPGEPASRKVLAGTVAALVGVLLLMVMGANHAAPLFSSPDLSAGATPSSGGEATATLDPELVRK